VGNIVKKEVKISCKSIFFCHYSWYWVDQWTTMQLALSWIFIGIIIVYKPCKLNKWNLMKSLVHLVYILIFKPQLKGIQDVTLHWLLQLVVNMRLPTLVHFKSKTKRVHIPTIGSVKLQQSLLYSNKGDNSKDTDSMPLMINFHE